MKVKYRYLIIMLILAVLFAAGGTVVINMWLGEIKKAEFDNQVRLIAAVRKAYPEVSDEELLKVLDGEGDEMQTKMMLREYGITDSDWAVYENKGNASRMLICCNIMFLAMPAVFIAVFFVY